jgi:hypothetical protein
MGYAHVISGFRDSPGSATDVTNHRPKPRFPAHRGALVCALAALGAAAGCSDEAPSVPPGFTDEPGPSVVFLRQRVLGFTLSAGVVGPPELLPGARVCIDDASGRIGCTESDQEGFFRFDGLPKYSLLAVTAEHDGYISVLEPFITTKLDVDLQDTLLYKQLVMLPVGAESIVGPADLVLDSECGSIAAFAILGGTVETASEVRIETDAGSASHFGDPLRVVDAGAGACNTAATDDMRYLPGANATSGGCAAGLPAGAVFWNVSADFHDVTFQHPTTQCQLLGRTSSICLDPVTGFACPGRNLYGYPTDSGNTVRVPVRAGFMTRYAAATCP